MRKAIFIFIAIILVAASIDWIRSCSGLKSHKEVFRRELTYADMYEYKDKDYDYVVRIPSFFTVQPDSLQEEKGRMRFEYGDQWIAIVIESHVMPGSGQSLKDGMDSLAQVLQATDRKLGSDYFILNLWNGVVNLRALYLNSDASMLQNGILIGYNSQMFNVRTGLDFSFWKDMHLRYGLTFGQNRMKIQSMDYNQTIDNWKQDLSIIIPISPFTIDLQAEYYRNEIISGNYKDFFLADIRARYKSKHLDLTLSLNNLLNRDTYSYVITNDLTSSTSTNRIRGRELLLTAYYKL